MKHKLVRLLLSASSFSGVVLFLLIGSKQDVPFLGSVHLNAYHNIPKYALYIALVTAIAWAVLQLTALILKSNDTLQVGTIRPMESNFLPAYIGLFVIALELNSNFSIENMVLLILLFVFWIFLENVSYFNPFFLLFGYRFYEVTSREGRVFTIITKKKDLKSIQQFNSLIRISNFSYLEK